MADGRAQHRAQARGGVDGGLDRFGHASFIFGNGVSSKRKVPGAGAKTALTVDDAERDGILTRKWSCKPMTKRLYSLTRNIFLAVASLVLACSARALTINVTYDSSVTTLGTLAQVQTAVGAAVQTIQSLYTNNSTINITVYSANAGPFGDIGLGESSTFFTGDFVYSDITNALRSARTTLADSNSVASLPVNDPTGGTQPWLVATAEAKALGGLNISANDPGEDGEIGFATGTAYTFDPNNRAVSGKFDFIGVAEHEITEVMGRNTFGLNNSGGYVPFDLFRFTSSGVRSFETNDTGVYFSVDNGVTALKPYNPNNGGDIQDWATSSPRDSFDAFITSGVEGILSAADLTALDVIGYKLNYKPPRLTGATLGNGSFQLNFTNTPGTTYTILATTNVSQSISNWTVLGNVTETAAGQFQFTDTQAAGKPLRFYRVRLN
jgi:hypothetical protein